MGDIFLSVLKISLSASVVAGIVMLARLCLRRAPRIFSYALWGAVLLRLIFPFTIPIHVSFLPIISQSEESAAENAVWQDEEAEEPVNVGAGNAATPAQAEVQNINEQTAAETVPAENGRSFKEVALSVAATVWLVGAAGMLGYAAWSYLAVRKRMSVSFREQDNIYKSRKIGSAFVLGYLRPLIYIPEGLNAGESEIVILHEQTHIRRGDNIFKLLAFIALSVHWMNPVMWLSYALMCRDMEQSCDEAVVREMCGSGGAISEVKRRYGEMLITTAERKMRFAPVYFSGNSTKERMVSIMKYSPAKKKVMAGASVICVLAMLLSLASCVSLERKDSSGQGKPYLSVFVTSQETGETSAMRVNNPDKVNQSIEKAAETEYTLQSTRSAYDRENGIVYYAELTDDLSDQLFSYDVKTGETAQLTTKIYGISSMCFADGAVYMIAAMQDTHHLTMTKYEPDAETLLIFDTEGVWNFELMTCDVYNDRVYASACRVKEQEEALTAANEAGTKYIAPDYTVFVFTEDFFVAEPVLKTEKKLIRRMAARPDGSLFVTLADSIPEWEPEYASYMLDTESKELTPAFDIDSVMYVTEYICFLSDASSVYFVGVDGDERGVYKCELESGETELILKSDEGFINGLCVSYR